MKQEKDREKYNQKTLDAMKEAKEIARDSNVLSYETMDELKADLEFDQCIKLNLLLLYFNQLCNKRRIEEERTPSENDFGLRVACFSHRLC